MPPERNYLEDLEAYRKSLGSDPSQAQVWFLSGCAETSLKEFATAALSFQKALDLRPDWPQAKHNLGRAYFELGRIEEAQVLFREAAGSVDSELPLTAIVVTGPANPANDNQTILNDRRAWAQRYLGVVSSPRKHTLNSKPRIGYLSSFFEYDNWMKPVWGLINRHDRNKFDVHLFSDAPSTSIKHGYRPHESDHFHDISGLSNEDVASKIEAAGIDLLVDLNGYSAPGRLGAIALRPAPVIAAWFNMYATSGISAYDYLIGDCEVIPEREEEFYCEKIIRVPGSYLTFEVNYPVPPIVEPPCLKNHAITFGCLAPQHKINGTAVHTWSRILQEVPDSRLLLRNGILDSPGNRQFVQSLFEKNGIDPQRLLLRGRIDHYRFLETYNEIDIVLDTFPYNGGTTTMEALWQGVPVIAFSGDRWASRISSSLLRAANLDRFVARSLEDYLSLAVRLGNSAGTPDALAALRREMRSKLSKSPVCDTQTFTHNMESIYREVISLART